MIKENISMKRMNRKIILLPLALAAFVGLTGCGNLTSSSSKSGIIIPTSSSTASTSSSSGNSNSSGSSAAVGQTLSDLDQAGTYDVKGVVVALTTKSYVIHDDKAGALVYVNAAPSVKLGDYIEAKQTLVDGTYMPYNGLYQFSAADKTNALTVTTASGTKPTIPAAIALTSAVADGWKTKGSTTPSTLRPTDVTLFSWTTTAVASGNYITLNLSGSATVIESAYLDSTAFSIAAGKTYDLEGYFIGYSKANSFASVAITKATEKIIVPTAISITSAGGATSVRVAETLALTATVTPDSASDKSVTWSSGDETKATVSTAGIVTGVAETDSVVITATSVAAPSVKNTIALVIAAKAATPVASVAVAPTAVTLIAGGTQQLTPTVLPAEANQSVSYASDAAGFATVSSTGLITAVAVGTANITATTLGLGADSLPKTAICVVTVRPQIISDIKAAGTFDVKGVVAAVNTKGFVLHDGITGIYVYLGSVSTNPIGTYIEVNGVVTIYNGQLEFGNPSPVITVLTGTAPTLPAAIALTSAVATSWVITGTTPTTSVQQYTWTSICGMSGTYFTLPIDGSTTAIEPSYVDSSVFKLVSGNRFTVTGYFIGYNTGNSYAAFMLTGLVASYDAATSVSVTGGASTVNVGASLQLAAAVLPATANQAVTWATSDATKATVDSTGKVAGVAIGSVTITATSTTAGIAGTKVLTVADVTYSYTSQAAFDFSALPTASTTTPYGLLDVAGVLGLFDGTNAAVTRTGTNPFTACTTATKAYIADKTQGPKVYGVKLGASSNGVGTMALTSNVTLGKVIITVYAWSASKLAAVTVGDAAPQTLTADAVTTAVNLTFTYSPSTTLTISTSMYCVITKIEVFAATAA
jgi:uncharacterized protein YjdB